MAPSSGDGEQQPDLIHPRRKNARYDFTHLIHRAEVKSRREDRRAFVECCL